jgi:catechol 2,3-dioxygenase-like lactoylglutathione lyase family enzyme
MLHHVGIEVDDFDVAQDFYLNTLGLTARTDRPGGAPGLWLKAGDVQRINIGVKGTGTGRAHFALAVEDFESTVTRLRRAGVAIHELTSPVMNVAFDDPFGNEIELRQPPEVWEQRYA